MTASASRLSKPRPGVATLGVPRELKAHEGRVALTPDGVRRIRRLGTRVLIEKGAGKLSGFPDAAYRAAGAQLVGPAEVWRRSELIVKIKEPVGIERKRLRTGQALFCYLHLAPDPELTRVLLDKKILGIDYEHVELDDGRAPLLYPMSDVAGHLCIALGSYYLAMSPNGPGMLLGGLSGEHAGQVVVVGAGSVGRAAAREALAIEANVTVLDRSQEALRRVRAELGRRVRATCSTRASLARAVKAADLLIGAVYSHGERAPRVITRSMVRSMKPGSVVMDVAIDQGGCVETSHPTTHDEPVFLKYGVIHYAVTNMPGAVPRTSTPALTGATLPYIERLARHGAERALARYPELGRAVNTRQGRLIHPGVRRSLPNLARRGS